MKNVMLACVPCYFSCCYFLPSTWNVMFSHSKFQIRINTSHITLLQYVWIKPHLSGLTDVKNYTSNFDQSIQVWCREKEKEENNENCQAFCVIRKRNRNYNYEIRLESRNYTLHNIPKNYWIWKSVRVTISTSRYILYS